ncbi:MAG: hypothetical protein HY996_03950 [Micrococcales bacterium]|nr:hypothetical protein [Micrococcales bacterium]
MKSAVAAVALASMATLAAGCVITSSDSCSNYCSDTWYLNKCVDGTLYGTDCNLECMGQTCDDGTPAVAGECAPQGEGDCVCWCADAFDECLDDHTIRFTRDEVTYELDCQKSCDGPCDAAARACACP